MGNIRQKKKRLSKTSRATHKPKSKKRHLANAIVAANWDKNETLAQNYRRLGLISKLNNASGGSEKMVLPDELKARFTTATSLNEEKGSLIIEKGQPTQMEVGEIDVERDPETGRILKVLNDARNLPARPNLLGDPLNDVLEEDELSEVEVFNGFLHVPKPEDGDSAVVRALREKARNGRRKEPRMQSSREKGWIISLIEKHGDDYTAMFWDAQLNPMQQSIGDIKARVKKYRETRRRV